MRVKRPVLAGEEVTGRQVLVVVAVLVGIGVFWVLFAVGYLFLSSVQVERSEARASASASAAGVQVGAPCPADVEYLDEILAIEGDSLPEGAEVVSVEPAVNFAEAYPGGWGYVIEFTASDQAIRDYTETYTAVSGSNIEMHSEATPVSKADGLEDIDLQNVSNPMRTRLHETVLVLERPLGRGWLVIRGGGR
ncbi:hypothetical protein SAMN05216355_11817 [Actinomyces ruminicola]|uniref:Uncharacterized protein n=1 Tax=Actinomyces ruminicola TaxID=332524 RepID=A0A1H0ER12_9ACTO|nr:hypothetical protein [Actinomyces ruminicola]SDN84766.1 hypothetical protein SAMN05216355_11817 [Actinomyces ruminicola]